MKTIQSLIEKAAFIKVDNWQKVVGQDFNWKSGAYSYVTVTEMEVEYKTQTFRYPVKVVFECGYLKQQKVVTTSDETTINGELIKIIERKKFIPIGLYQKNGKFSGHFPQIIDDILEGNNVSSSYYFNDLLTTRDNPLYSIDSTQKWASYLLVLKKENKNIKPTNDRNDEFVTFLNGMLDGYGIHYDFEETLQDLVLIVFPAPYLRVVENRIKKTDSGESVFLVFELNFFSFLHLSQREMTIDAVIKNTEDKIIYQKVEKRPLDYCGYQTVELFPEQKSEIGHAAVSIKINDVLVDKVSGYYMRKVNINLGVKE